MALKGPCIMRKILLASAALIGLAAFYVSPAKAGGSHFEDLVMDNQALVFMQALGLSVDPNYLPSWGAGVGNLSCGEKIRYDAVAEEQMPRVHVICFSFSPYVTFSLVRRMSGQSLSDTTELALANLRGVFGSDASKTEGYRGADCKKVDALPGTVQTLQCTASGSAYTHDIFIATVERGGSQYDYLMHSVGKFGTGKRAELWTRYGNLLHPLAPPAPAPVLRVSSR